MSNYTPNATPENIRLNILHEAGNYWISNEGTKKAAAFHVWEIGITHSTCDSAYNDMSLAVARCNYLAERKESKMLYNGKTLEYIAGNFPANMPEIHREQYLANCKEVIKNESEGFNLDYCQLVRNSNFRLIEFYLTNN